MSLKRQQITAIRGIQTRNMKNECDGIFEIALLNTGPSYMSHIWVLLICQLVHTFAKEQHMLSGELHRVVWRPGNTSTVAKSSGQ